MKRNIILISALSLIFGCHPRFDYTGTSTLEGEDVVVVTEPAHTFHKIAEVANEEYLVWRNLNDTVHSIKLKFSKKDTLSVLTSNQCLLDFPFQIKENKIVVSWDTNIAEGNSDFKMNEINSNYIGMPFMLLEIKNDSILKAAYPIKDLMQAISEKSKALNFPSEFGQY